MVFLLKVQYRCLLFVKLFMRITMCFCLRKEFYDK